MRIAIAGATGHIGRALAWKLGAREEVDLELVARRPDAARAFAREWVGGHWTVSDFPDLGRIEADALIDCTGIGDPSKLTAGLSPGLDELDRAFTGWLRANPGSRGIALSSGVVYDTDFASPADDGTPLRDPAAAPSGPGDEYALAKARAEAAHRASETPIVDLRIFGFHSRMADPDAGTLLGDITRALRDGSVLEVGRSDIARDHISPSDLASLVLAVLAAPPRNDALDAVSASPVMVSELLEHFAERFSLRYTVADAAPVSPTGAKPAYYSTSRRALEIGYRPTATSLETLTVEVEASMTTRPQGENLT